MELAIVVPTFNERQNVIELIDRLHETLAGVEHEIIVVDDDSPDGTASAVLEVARRDRRVRLIHRIGRTGLSSACVEGMMSTTAPFVAVIDADLQHDERMLPAMLALLKSEGLDLVVGTRQSTTALSPWRARLSEAGKWLSGLVTHSELQDPMSGFFIIDRRFLQDVVHSLSSIGFKILLDIVASSPRPVRLAEVPYQFRERLHGQSKLDVLTGLEYLWLLADKSIGSLIPTRFALFALVGSVGVLFHLAVLYAMVSWAGQPFMASQLAATILVMTSNFFLNNLLTWRDHRLAGVALFWGLLKFYAACSIGAFLNLRVAFYALEHRVPWVVAGFAGLVIGSVWNFAVTAATTWRRGRRAR